MSSSLARSDFPRRSGSRDYTSGLLPKDVLHAELGRGFGQGKVSGRGLPLEEGGWSIDGKLDALEGSGRPGHGLIGFRADGVERDVGLSLTICAVELRG